jgi:hypothetical protein
MKIRKISILSALSLGLIIAFSGCKKDDGAIRSSVTIIDIPAITTTIDASGSQAIDLLNLASFSGKYKVDLYFPGTAAPAKVDISIRKNGSNANVKVLKTGVTTFPSTLTVTASDIQSLFGTAIVLGDSYDVAPDIYVGDKKYEAFPASGAGSGAGPVAMPGFSEYARFAAICAYDPTIYAGTFTVVQDDWQDFTPGDKLTLTKVDATHFSFINPFVVAPTPVPVVVAINTANNQASIAKIVIGSYWNYGPGSATNYPNPAVSTGGAATASFVAPCAQTVTLLMTYYFGPTSGTTYAGYKLVLKK